MSYGLKFFAVLSCLFLALPTFVRAQETGEKELKILFIGNSYTFFNSLDKTVGDMLTVSGIPTKTSRSLPGGWSFERHFKGEVPNNYKGEPTPEMIKKEKWDYVVLQEQSAAAVNNHAKFMEFGKKLVDMIHEIVHVQQGLLVLLAFLAGFDAFLQIVSVDVRKAEIQKISDIVLIIIIDITGKQKMIGDAHQDTEQNDKDDASDRDAPV